MRAAILGFVAGVSWLQHAAALPQPVLLALLVPSCAAVAAAYVHAARLRQDTARTAARTTCLAFAGMALGYTWAALLAHAALAPHLDPKDEGRDLDLVGTVASLPYNFDGGVRFNFAVEHTLTPNAQAPPLVALSWYAGRDGQAAPPDIQPGQRWRLTARLQRPHGNANPGGFDYEAWLLGQGVRATGYVRARDENRLLAAFVPGASAVVERSRALLRARILAALRGREYAGVIVALVIGDQRGIDQADWQVFNRTGIGHLVSI